MNEKLEAFIRAYLEINPTPTDEQIHCLASTINLDKETFEAAIYAMLGEKVHAEDSRGDMLDDSVIEADATDVLEGKEPVETLKPEDAVLNDGDPDGTADADQELLRTDGAPADELGLTESPDILDDDGIPDLNLDAGE